MCIVSKDNMSKFKEWGRITDRLLRLEYVKDREICKGYMSDSLIIHRPNERNTLQKSCGTHYKRKSTQKKSFDLIGDLIRRMGNYSTSSEGLVRIMEK